jgi:hypothetical protein
MTMHGVNSSGLDERESFLAQLGGIADALTEGVREFRISIAEREPSRAERMRSILKEVLPPSALQHAGKVGWRRAKEIIRPITAGADSESKPHVFVAMPFSKDLEDV